MLSIFEIKDICCRENLKSLSLDRDNQVICWNISHNTPHSAGEEAACQYEAHEAARSLHPLMFDYCNEAQPRRLSLRIGKEYRKVQFCLWDLITRILSPMKSDFDMLDHKKIYDKNLFSF